MLITENFSAVIHKGKILRHFQIFQIYNDIYNEFFTQHNLRTDKTSSQVLFNLSRKSFGRVFTIDINCKRAEQINNQDLERFPIRQNILLDLFKCKWNARHFPEQPETFRGIPVFLFQAVGTEISFPFAQFCLIGRLEFIPPFSMFPGKRCLRAVAVFLFISYRNVENGNCICRRKIVLDSFDFVKIRSQSNFHFWTKFNSILRRNCRKVPAVLQHTFSLEFFFT